MKMRKIKSRVAGMVQSAAKTPVQFVKDVKGSVTAFTLVIFLMLVVGGGMAVDFMRHEAHRVELQDALDRGVLAAASSSQTMDAEDTVHSYLRTTEFVNTNYRLRVTETPAGAVRVVTAAAELELDTYFLKIVGRNSMKVAAHSSATEAASNMEISLVLDVSASMDRSTSSGGDRITRMRLDAEAFVTSMLTEETKDNLTISLIPYGGATNPGRVAFEKYARTQVHPYSYCLDFPPGETLTPTAPADKSIEQMQFFSLSNPGGNREFGWCPGGDDERIIYHSNDVGELVTHIRGLKTHDGTGSQYSLKWATMLLDPSSRPLTRALADAGEVLEEHRDLPVDYNTEGVLKFVVFMTDGRTYKQRRVDANHYDTADDRDWWATNKANGGRLHDAISTDEARAQFRQMCETTKSTGVLLFTIGFEVPEGSDADGDLAGCASPGHYHNVTGEGLGDAFAAVASTIQKLKLIN